MSNYKGMMHKVLHIIVLLLLVILVSIVSYWAGFASHLFRTAMPQVIEPPSFIPQSQEPPEFKIYWEAWEQIQERFYGQLPEAKAQVYGSIRGMLAALGDPHTFFIEPPQREIEEAQLQGRYGGIGADYTMEGGYLVVVAAREGYPASRAGILPGDIIVAVDGREVLGLSQDEIVALINGPVGTEVELTIWRRGETESLLFTLTREEITAPTVAWEVKEEKIGYIQLSLFSERTRDEVRQALGQLRKDGATAFILDLRNNPGGLVNAAVDVASEFLADGVVFYERDGQGKEETFPVRKGGLATDSPLVILVNGGTASAAEIVAGVLQDRGRAILIGERTFGKGSVQSVHELSDGSSIHVTMAHWFTPKGHEIEGTGLSPDIEVPLTPEDKEQGLDPQLEEALKYLRPQVGSPTLLEGQPLSYHIMSSPNGGNRA